MGGACSKREMRYVYRTLIGKPEDRDVFGELDVDERITLKLN
jgi:hypothetical protein